jgi:hypothetical protein
MKWRIWAIYLIIVIISLAVAIQQFRFTIERADRQARQNRQKIHHIIEVGQNLEEGIALLEGLGFEMAYQEPRVLTKDDLHQLVRIRTSKPSSLDSIAQVTGFSWIPFTHKEARYLVIHADSNGIITAIK